MNIRKQQAENTRKRICKAVEALLEEKEADEISIKDICTKVGIGVGTFYHYYSSKEEALYDISTPIDIYFEETVKPLLRGKTQKEQLVIFFDHQAEYTLKHIYPSKSSKTELRIFKNFFTDERYFQKLLSDILKGGEEFTDYIEQMTLLGLTNHLLFLSRGIMITWVGDGGQFDLKQKVNYEVNLFLELHRRLNEKSKNEEITKK